MNVVITMAGLGSRFKKAGYTCPKYMIEVRNRTLFVWSMLSLKGFADMAKQRAAKATLSLLGSSPISDKTLEKFGFKLAERNYLMEN